MKIQVSDTDVVYGSFTLKPNGLEVDGIPSFEDWMRCGDFIRNAQGAVHFWIGDWLNYGERVYGEVYAQAMDETHYKYQTLANDKWVSKSIPPSRRRETLTWSHHAEVADLMPEDQDILLTRAVEEKLDSKQFRQLARQYKLKMEVPEMRNLPRETPLDFAIADRIINPSITSLDELQAIDLDKMHPDARDYLLSHLKLAVGIMAGILEKYGK